MSCSDSYKWIERKQIGIIVFTISVKNGTAARIGAVSFAATSILN